MIRNKIFLPVNFVVFIFALIFLVFNSPIIKIVVSGTVLPAIWTYNYSVSETYLIYVFIMLILMNIFVNFIPVIKKFKNEIIDVYPYITLIITFLLSIILLIHSNMMIFSTSNPDTVFISFEYLWPGGYSLILLIISYIFICCIQVFLSFFSLRLNK